MKKIEDFGIRVPEILLPKNIDVKSWSVIACDQYTQDLDYWKRAESCAAGKPSTLNLILPEVYLGSPDKAQRIEKIRQSMKEYIAGGVFDTARKSMIYIERKTAFGRMRRGLVTQIDLEMSFVDVEDILSGYPDMVAGDFHRHPPVAQTFNR